MIRFTNYEPALTFPRRLERQTFRTTDGPSRIGADKDFVYHVPAQSEAGTDAQAQDDAGLPGTLIASDEDWDPEALPVSRLGLPDGSALIVRGKYNIFHRLISPSDDSADVPELPPSEASDTATFVEASYSSELLKQVISWEVGLLLPGSEASVWTFSPAFNVKFNLAPERTLEDLARTMLAFDVAMDNAMAGPVGDVVIAFGDICPSDGEVSKLVAELRQDAETSVIGTTQ
jgi:hypothetical protein